MDLQDWELLERESGVGREEMRRFAVMLHQARCGVFVWSMGLTQHKHGVDTVEALINVALALGWVGREHCGLMPIRGHSGVQGGAEVGCSPMLDDEQRKRFERVWEFALPDGRGLTATGMISAAYRGELDTFWITGGNFLETLPDPAATGQALLNVKTRIHQDLVLSSMMLLEPRENVVLLPAATRYESPGGGTETSTERRIIFSPEIEGRRIGSAKPEWEVFGEVAARVRPDLAEKVRFRATSEIRNEISKCVPLYAGIEKLGKEGDNFQWGGERLFEDGRFATADSKAHFSAVMPKPRTAPSGMFYLTTRRGKQFNSMVQKSVDPLTAASRDSVLISQQDAHGMGLAEGDPVLVVSNDGTLTARIKIDRIKPGNVEMHWPEANCLLSRREIDPRSEEPDYNTLVRIERWPQG